MIKLISVTHKEVKYETQKVASELHGNLFDKIVLKYWRVIIDYCLYELNPPPFPIAFRIP
jgi:hypothetical protein